jgi:hypothetical protein
MTHRTRRRRDATQGGLVVAAAWLIGIGLVFLVRDALGLDWGEAWPLFVIMFGGATFVSELVYRTRRLPLAWALTWPIAVIVVGVLFLLSTTGTLGVGLGDLIGRWWPVALIVLGAWFLLGAAWPGSTPSSEETLRLPLAAAPSADVRIRFGAGELTVGAARAGTLVDGEFIGGVVHRQRGPGAVELEQPEGTWALGWDRQQAWTMGLTTEVPLDLRLETGANRTELDLTGHRLRTLTIKTGASETRVRLPRAAGESRVRAEAGAAQLILEVPDGVAARIRSQMVIGTTNVDTARFPRSAGGYESPDYGTATNRVEIDITGGVGAVRITGPR